MRPACEVMISASRFLQKLHDEARLSDAHLDLFHPLAIEIRDADHLEKLIKPDRLFRARHKRLGVEYTFDGVKETLRTLRSRQYFLNSAALVAANVKMYGNPQSIRKPHEL